jgi:hypothetical protein
MVKKYHSKSQQFGPQTRSAQMNTDFLGWFRNKLTLSSGIAPLCHASREAKPKNPFEVPSSCQVFGNDDIDLEIVLFAREITFQTTN